MIFAKLKIIYPKITEDDVVVEQEIDAPNHEELTAAHAAFMKAKKEFYEVEDNKGVVFDKTIEDFYSREYTGERITKIKEWHYPEPQPTQAEIDAVTDEEAQSYLEYGQAKKDIVQTDADMARLFEDYLLEYGEDFINSLTGKQKEKWQKRQALAEKVRAK